MTSEDKFDYEGTLIFNRIYKTEAAEEDAELDRDALDNLTTFQSGEPGNEKSGFEDIDFHKYFERYENLPPFMMQVANHVEGAEFKEESFDQPDELVDKEGNPTDGWERTTRSSYLYWDDPSCLFLQGSKGKVGNLKSQLSDDWGGEIELVPLEFDPDFLLYLVKLYDDQNTVNGIEIKELNDALLSDGFSSHGEQNEIRESNNITEALPVIAGILLNYAFQEIEGRFTFNNTDITVNIQTKVRDTPTGRVHIKVEDAINGSTDLERTLISLDFMRRIIHFYNEWKEMDDKEKYVHPEYFAQLHRRATDLPESAEYDFPLDDLVEDYAEKRGEDMDDYDLDWGTHDQT